MRRPGALIRAIAGAILAACATAHANAAPTAIRVVMKSDIRSTDPGVNRDDNTDVVVLHTVEGLVAYGHDGTPKPLLAESVAVSPDGLTYTFALRRGVTFHNGATLTSEDVLWSWARYIDPKTAWRCLADFDGRAGLKVEAVEAPTPDIVTFRLNRPSALFLSSLARLDCGMTAILHRDSLNPDGTWRAPVGTGPFRLAEWKRGESIRLAKFDRYASRVGEPDGYAGAKRPLVDEIRFSIIPDDATAKAALLNGDVDVLWNIANADYRELKDDKRVRLIVDHPMSMTGLLFQTQDPILKSAAMRRAIAAAIDLDQLVGAVSDGLGQPNPSIVPSSSPYHTAVEDKGQPFDPALAAKLAAEAGYKGQPLTMLANKRYPQSFDAAVIVQAMLQSAGINANLEVLDWATQLDRYSTGRYQMMAFPYSARLDPSLSFETIMGPKSTQPRKVWDDKDAQAILEDSMRKADPAARQADFDELHRRFVAAAPMVMLYNSVAIAALSPRIVGYTTGATAQPRLWEVSVRP